MDYEVKKNVKVMLSLDVKEAKWLKGVCQNPFDGVHPSNESIEDARMREKFYHALNTSLRAAGEE